jgi:hypothetical protein
LGCCIILTHQAHQTVIYWPIKQPYGCPNLTWTQLATIATTSLEKHVDGWMEELEVTGSSTHNHDEREEFFYSDLVA